ncbi:MAG: hypothetical protein CMJ90_11580, partial [Planctomycetes bacterium]|nr:hypothetical protein [Planctomycetota bacterium]
GAANFDPREEAVVLSRDAEKLGLAASQGSTWVRDGPPAKIEVVSYRPTRVSFRYEATVPTAVLVADTFHPGWSATSGGDDLPLARADHALRMVLLPAGRGTLHMTFMPHSLLIGAAISIAGLLAMTAWGVWWRRQPRT